jgi:rhamnose utilization protein RhaD (predicted bifunctional aldolase and dehydrogenase)
VRPRRLALPNRKKSKMIQSRWNEQDEKRLVEGKQSSTGRDLALRIYSAQLIGADADLVLHGGGNTSVKLTMIADDGQPLDVIHIKGSGHDLATIDLAGMPAVRAQPLEKFRNLDRLDDLEMVAGLRHNLLDPNAPTPSLEALLHAYLPGRYVDHTHSTAALVIANQPDAAELATQIYGDRLAIVPYVMPGFELSVAADKIFRRAPADCEGLFLVNHGLFTQGETARQSYDRMIAAVSAAEAFLEKRGIVVGPTEAHESGHDSAAAPLMALLHEAVAPLGLTHLRFCSTPTLRAYSRLPDLAEITGRGTATPDHVIRTKPFPLILAKDASMADVTTGLEKYARRYQDYFERNLALSDEPKVMLDPFPRVVVVPGLGAVGIGHTAAAASIVGDLVEQTSRVIVAAEALGRYSPIKEAQLFQMEYWSLEQAKLRKG